MKGDYELLGAVVRHPLKPANDFVPRDNPLKYNKGRDIEPKARAKLSSLGNLAFKGEQNDSVNLAGKVIRYKRLEQHSLFWRELVTDSEFIGTVPRWVAGAKTWPPCLVVGITIAEQVEIQSLGTEHHERLGKIELPIAAVANFLPAVAHPGMQAGTQYDHTSDFKATIPRAEIFALELRTISAQRKWLRKRKLLFYEYGPTLGSARLAGNSDSDEDDEVPEVEDLVLGTFTDGDYAQMT
ncbi:hypothetical protein IQ07DRAFT_30880 [Pyrenochaeta sp. DS3sAY3a]|nr:hypothetical protein IQ07DRAFT_30880 [Pyrenochaeta sp. DS3sAY3a]